MKVKGQMKGSPRYSEDNDLISENAVMDAPWLI
jgi:hypothetical protein